MVLRYRNTFTNPLPVVRLRLDPNLNPQQSLEIAAVEDGAGKALPWAYRPLKFVKLSSEKGAMDVTLLKALAPSEETTLSIHFHSKGNHIGTDLVMLQDDPYWSFNGWYPRAMTPRVEEWSVDDDRLADYSVTMQLPAAYAVASTGRKLKEVRHGDQRELQLQSEHTRGFSIYASPQWQRHEKKIGKLELGVCLPAEAESWAGRLLDAAADSIAFYEKEYGPFPAENLDIACPGNLNERAHGSSAACNVIVIFLGRQLEKQYRFLTAHEIAHQYFGVSVGFPRETIGWVPVGLGLMMDEHCARSLGFDATYGRKIMREFYFRAEKMGFDTTLSQSVEIPMQSPPPWSFGWLLSLTHGKAYGVCAMLRDLVGPDRFQGIIKSLLAEHRGGLIREEDLIRACEAALGEKLDWFTADWIKGRSTFDYAITDAKKTEDGWDVEVKRMGTGSFPVLVELVTDKDEKLHQRMDRTKETAVLHFKTDGLLKTASANPGGFYPDLDSENDIWPRKAQ